MVMELCEKSMTKHLEGKKLNEDFVLDLIYQVGLGLDYLHSIGICHRDIKTENILVKGNVLKIADFGFATKSSMMNTHLGTKPYMAPEFFASEDDEEYTTKVDVWALNTCLYYICAKKFYFYSHNPKEMERQIMGKEFIIEPQLGHLSKPVQDLLKQGYQKNPLKRLSMRDYISHSAFDKCRKNYLAYPPNCASSGLGDLSFDNLKLEQRMSLDIGQVAKLCTNFLNFRNNLLLYTRLAKMLENKQFSRIFIFLLVKKHIQHLALAVCVMRSGEVPATGPLGKLAIDPTTWASFTKNVYFGQVGALLWSDLRKLSEKLPQLFKNMLNAGRPEIEIPNMDLNIECTNELVEYCGDLNEKIQRIVGNRPAPDLEKLGKMVQLVVQYEKVDPLRLVLGFNNIEE